MKTRLDKIASKPSSHWLLGLLISASLILAVWQTPLPGLAHRQVGTQAFLQAVLRNKPSPDHSGAMGAIDVVALQSAISHLEQANRGSGKPQARVNSYRTLGLVELAADNPADARVWFIRRLETHPADIIARFFLGQAYLRLGDMQAAAREWEAVGAQRQLMALAEALVERKEWSAALTVLDAVMRLDATDMDSRWLAAEIWRQQGDSDRALELYRAMSALAPDSLGPRQHAVEILAERGDVKQALELCQEIIATAPENPNGYVLSGVILFDDEQFEHAIMFFEQALQRNPSDPRWILVKLGNAYAALGQWPHVIDTYQRAIRQDPTHHWDYALLGDAYCQLGNARKAQSCYQQAVAHGNQSGRIQQAIEYITQYGECPP